MEERKEKDGVNGHWRMETLEDGDTGGWRN